MRLRSMPARSAPSGPYPAVALSVDAALAEVIKLRQRRQLLELLFRPDALALGDPDTMADACAPPIRWEGEGGLGQGNSS